MNTDRKNTGDTRTTSTGLMGSNMRRGTMLIIEDLTTVAIGTVTLIGIIVVINPGMNTIITGRPGSVIGTNIVFVGIIFTVPGSIGSNMATVRKVDLTGSFYGQYL